MCFFLSGRFCTNFKQSKRLPIRIFIFYFAAVALRYLFLLLSDVVVYSHKGFKSTGENVVFDFAQAFDLINYINLFNLVHE